MNSESFRIALPNTGFLRLPQIIGNPNANPPVLALIPVCKSTWWAGVKSGRYPRPVKLGPRVTAWTVESVRALIERLAQADKPQIPSPGESAIPQSRRRRAES
jgi:prophage regulatory protein